MAYKNLTPIINTATPYLTEAAMYADQANQLQGYGYLVDGVGAFTYLGTVAGTAADYEASFLNIEGSVSYDSSFIFNEVNNKNYLDLSGILQRNEGYLNRYATEFIRADKVKLYGSQVYNLAIISGYLEPDASTFIGSIAGETVSAASPIITDTTLEIGGAKYYRVSMDISYEANSTIEALFNEELNKRVISISEEIARTYDSSSITPFNKLALSGVTKQGVVLTKDLSKPYMDDMVESPCVFYDPTLKKLVMVHTSYNVATEGSIGYATSDDGMVWTEQGQFYVPDNSFGEFGMTGPVMVLWDNKYYFFYIVFSQVGYESGEVWIGLSVGNSLDDFINNTAERKGKVIKKSNYVSWFDINIFHPSFYRFSGKWYMFLNCNGHYPDRKERVGFATADTLDGKWVIQDRPLDLLDDTIKPLVGNAIVSGDPSLFEMDGHIIMMFFILLTNGTALDYWSYTTKDVFPYGWKYGGQTTEANQPYDSPYAHKPYCIKFNNKLFHYYTAVGSQGRVIALQTSNL